MHNMQKLLHKQSQGKLRKGRSQGNVDGWEAAFPWRQELHEGLDPVAILGTPEQVDTLVGW